MRLMQLLASQVSLHSLLDLHSKFTTGVKKASSILRLCYHQHQTFTTLVKVTYLSMLTGSLILPLLRQEYPVEATRFLSL